MLSDVKQMSLFAKPVPILVIQSLATLNLCACPWPGQHCPGRPFLCPQATGSPVSSSPLTPDHRTIGVEKVALCFINSFGVLGMKHGMQMYVNVCTYAKMI